MSLRLQVCRRSSQAQPPTHTQICEEAAGAMDPARAGESPLLGKEASWKGSLTCMKLSCIYYESNSNISEKTNAKEIARGSAVARIVGNGKTWIGKRAWRILGKWYCWMGDSNEDAWFLPWPRSRECATRREPQYKLTSGVTDTLMQISLA